MTKAAFHLTRLPRDIQAVHLTGKWRLEQDVPSAETVQEQLHASPQIKGLVFDTKALTAWDSSILAFLVEVMKSCSEAGIQVSKKGLPKGVQQLMDLASAVPKKEDARKSVTHEPFLSKIGSDTLNFIKSAGELIAFIGEAFVVFIRLITGRARFRSLDLGVFLQDTGAQAVPIVSLISFLVGLILAFVGVMQLKLFGAEVFVADLVGIAMVRAMGAIMTGIIMAGRT